MVLLGNSEVISFSSYKFKCKLAYNDFGVLHLLIRATLDGHVTTMLSNAYRIFLRLCLLFSWSTSLKIKIIKLETQMKSYNYPYCRYKVHLPINS